MSGKSTVISSASDSEATGAAFVAMSRFVIANGMEAEVKAAFRGRPRLVWGVGVCAPRCAEPDGTAG